MPAARVIIALVAVAIMVLAVASVLTGNKAYLRWSLLLFKIAMAAGIVFFGVLVIERLW